MRKRSLWVRTPLLLLTLLQFSVPAAAAWADARIGEPSGPAHIESHSTAGCARIHPADCAFHRFLSAPLARNTPTVIRIREGRGISWTPAVLQRSAAATDLTLPDSRAPPTLS
ncbi:MAG TPA: hypothetical protein VKL19_13760 [Thermoanaerobaculia bacterium]|nr:hypothetical protein [Thermoanaerobaculia bacterium]